MPTEEELLAAIDANPEGDAPRLAHADWLRANGDPARAELIRLQVEGAVGWEQEQRVRELLDGNRKRWLEGRPALDGLKWEFERGYPEVAEFRTLKAFRAVGEEVFAHGARCVEFSCMRGDPKSLAAEPGLGHVRSLKLTFSYRGVGLLDLLRSPHLARLERLSVIGDGPSSEFLEGLAGLETLSLVALELSPWGRDVELSPEALEALAFSPRMGRLAELRLGSCKLAQSASALWQAGAFPSLESLALTRAQLQPASLAGLGGRRGLPRLRALDLSQNGLAGEGAEELVRSGRRLRRLVLDHAEVGDAGAIALAGAGCLAGLERLELGSNGVSDAGARAIANSPHLRSLRALGLEDNLIDEAGVLALGRSRCLPALSRLGLGHNPAPPALVKAVEERFRDGTPPIEEAPAVHIAPAPVADAPTVGDADEDGLVRAIWADPWDEVARSVYADWLEEKGKPHHAALLRPGRPGGREAATKQIISAAQDDAPCALTMWPTDEGLVQIRVPLRSLRLKRFEREGPAWLRRHSVSEVAPEGASRDWAALFAADWLAHARGLSFERIGVGAALLRGLAGSPHLAGLASLNLYSARASGGELASLMRASGWAGLCRLACGDDYSGVEALRALVSSPIAAGLRHLVLRACYPTLEAATLMAGSPSLRGLVTLTLSRASIGLAELKALADSSALASLRNLDLAQNYLGDLEYDLLSSSAVLPRLRRLRLSHNRGTQQGLVRLARAIAATPHCWLVLASSEVVGRHRKALLGILGKRLVLE